MAILNRFQIIGTLTKDPDLRYQENGTPLCVLDVAVNGHRREGEKFVPHTEFFNNIAVWGKQGEACGKHLTQGSLVLVEGSLKMDSYTEKPAQGEAEGKKRRVMAFAVDNVQFLRIKRPGDTPEPESAPQG